ncbi:MAG: right-handed parallel beta-helix repeat-containing protein, partial [Methylocella sp.]
SLQVGPTPSGTPGTITFNLVETMTGTTNTPNKTYGFSVSELAAIPVNMAVPTITGTAQVGQTLTASHGTWTNAPTSYTYQWKSSASGTIAGATAASYVPVTSDIGNTLTVSVVAANASGSSAPAASAATKAVAAAGSVPANSVLPTISGVPQVGQTLTASTGTWTNAPASFTYQWNRAGTAIGGAIASTYVPVAADVGATLTVSVVATNSAGSSSPATSAATSAIAGAAAVPVNTALPAISGVAQVGQTLTATNGTWTNSPTSFTYQWNRAGTLIGGAIASTYVPVAADVGATLTVSVVATNATGSSAPAISAPTSAVFAAAPGQHPTLLNSYVLRPPWQVAGVDYPVGLPAGTVLTDWQAMSGPGITVNSVASPPNVTIDGANNIVISNVDFSLHNGAYLYITNSSGVTIDKCNFGGTNMQNVPSGAIVGTTTAQNITVTNTTIDGNGTPTSLDGSLIVLYGGGTNTVSHNWIKNSAQQSYSPYASGVHQTVIYRNNLVEQSGKGTGAHANYLQFGGAQTDSVDVEYNTFYNTPQLSGGEALQFYNNNSGGYIHNCTWAFNVMIATGGAPGDARSYIIHGGAPADGNIGSGHDNYMDNSAAYGPYYSNSMSGWTLSNNFDMTTGALIPKPPEAH